MESNSVKGPIFFGEYELNIDDKNRLTLPAEIRKAFDPERDGQAFVVTVGTNGVVWLQPAKFYIERAMELPAEITPSDDQLAYDQVNFALAKPIEWDKQGRILIPDGTLKRTNTGKTVTLIGARTHLQVWNRAAWEERREFLEKQRPDIAKRAMQARQASAT